MYTLPLTSKSHYLTGMTALNIHYPQEGYGDWHFFATFYGEFGRPRNIVLGGEGEQRNTNHIYGDYGIYECSAVLRQEGLQVPANQLVYAAGHYRAVLDMLYKVLCHHKYPYHLCLDEWFETEAQKDMVKEKARLMKPCLSEEAQQLLDRWISSN